jgi:hypothetical protein
MTNRASEPIHTASIVVTDGSTAPSNLPLNSSAAGMGERRMSNPFWSIRVSAWRLLLAARRPTRRRRRLPRGRLAGLRHQHTDCGPPAYPAWRATRASAKEAVPAELDGTGMGRTEPMAGKYLVSLRPPIWRKVLV